MIMVREEKDPVPENLEYRHGLTPPMRDARKRRFRREPDLNVGALFFEHAVFVGLVSSVFFIVHTNIPSFEHHGTDVFEICIILQPEVVQKVEHDLIKTMFREPTQDVDILFLGVLYDNDVFNVNFVLSSSFSS